MAGREALGVEADGPQAATAVIIITAAPAAATALPNCLKSELIFPFRARFFLVSFLMEI